MTAESGYVWFLPVYVSMKIGESFSWVAENLFPIVKHFTFFFFFCFIHSQNKSETRFNRECTEHEILRAMDGHFALSYKSFGLDTDIIDGGNETIAEWKQAYLEKLGSNKTHLADYSTYTYDAIWVYVKALKQLIKEGKFWY